MSGDALPSDRHKAYLRGAFRITATVMITPTLIRDE